MTTADELDVLTTMLEDTADNQTIQPHGDQSELRPTPRGRPEATHGREAPGAHHTPAPGPSKQHMAGMSAGFPSARATPPPTATFSRASLTFSVSHHHASESSFLLKCRDYEGDFCTLTDVMFSDALPVFATDHTIRPTAAATRPP